MSDFTTLVMNYNTGSDVSATWTGTALAFGTGGNELRWVSSGAGAATNTSSANWPYMTRPASSTSVVNQLWAFTADATGSQVATYDGTSSHYKQLRMNWDAVGTFAAAPQFTWFGDSTLTTPSAGDQTTQPLTISGAPIVNGQVTDTTSTSYMKMNAFGYGVDAAGAQQTPGANAAGTLSATVGTAGSVSPPSGAAGGSSGWLTSYQSMQGWTQYIVDAVTPKATTAGFWFLVIALYTGVNMATGSMLPTYVFQYSFS